MSKIITGRQIRMARSALSWRVDDLSKKSDVPWARIQKLERENSYSEDNDDKLMKIKSTFEKNGIVFVNENLDIGTEPYIFLKSV